MNFKHDGNVLSCYIFVNIGTDKKLSMCLLETCV